MKKLIFAGTLLLCFGIQAKELDLGSVLPLEDVKLLDISGKHISLGEAKRENGLLVIFSCNIYSEKKGSLTIDHGSGSETIVTDTFVAADNLSPAEALDIGIIIPQGIRTHLVGEGTGLTGLRWATYTGDKVAHGI